MDVCICRFVLTLECFINILHTISEKERKLWNGSTRIYYVSFLYAQY
jgi:hypothetical protein